MLSTTKARVLIVEDTFDTASFYNRLINLQRDLESVGVMGSADGVLEAAVELDVDVVLFDLVMPGANPIECIRSVAQSLPQAKIIAFSAQDNSGTVMAAFDAGAWGFVSKCDDPAAVVQVIRRAATSQK